MNNRFVTKNRIALVLAIGITVALIAIGNNQRRLLAWELQLPRSTGSYILQGLPIYQKMDNEVYRVNAIAFVEFARAMAVQNDSHSVSFDEKTLTLTVVSTPENLRRFGECIKSMYASMGVHFQTQRLDAEQIKTLIKGQNLEVGDTIRIE
jgi:hypothetical protein